MKITEKIVTSVTQPQQTNVLWHNPETGELKMFGNKGWEVVGGVPGEGGGSGGYPIVTVKDNFNIEAEPNTFYDIKNPINSEIIIVCNQLEIAPTRIHFIYDGSYTDEFGAILSSGLNVLFDDTKEGYNYKALVNLSSGIPELIDPIEIYFTNDIIQGGSTVALINVFGNEIQLSINNINIIKTENIVNEFIFNVNCPCSIQFDNIFSWNNGYAPDLTKQGICTISIVNGVGCYTFVNG
jgi:hypothetical protein